MALTMARLIPDRKGVSVSENTSEPDAGRPRRDGVADRLRDVRVRVMVRFLAAGAFRAALEEVRRCPDGAVASGAVTISIRCFIGPA